MIASASRIARLRYLKTNEYCGCPNGSIYVTLAALPARALIFGGPYLYQGRLVRTVRLLQRNLVTHVVE